MILAVATALAHSPHVVRAEVTAGEPRLDGGERWRETREGGGDLESAIVAPESCGPGHGRGGVGWVGGVLAVAMARGRPGRPR